MSDNDRYFELRTEVSQLDYTELLALLRSHQRSVRKALKRGDSEMVDAGMEWIAVIADELTYRANPKFVAEDGEVEAD